MSNKNAHSYLYDVYAQGISGWVFRTNLDRDEAVRIARNLANTEGICWIRKSNTLTYKAEAVYKNGGIEPIDLDEVGYPLGN